MIYIKGLGLEMRSRVQSIVTAMVIVLLVGSSALFGSYARIYREGLQNQTTNIEKISAADTSTVSQTPEKSILQADDRLPLIPHKDSIVFRATDNLYTFNFSAKEGDKIHLQVYVTRQKSLQVVLLPEDNLSDYLHNQSFSDIEKIDGASNSRTRHLKAHVTAPEDGDYTLILRTPDLRTYRVDMMIGRGLFSSMVIRAGGYVDLFYISSFVGIGIVVGIYLYKRRKKKSHLEKEGVEWREEFTDSSENDESPNEGPSSKPPLSEESDTESSTDNTEYLQYEE